MPAHKSTRRQTKKLRERAQQIERNSADQCAFDDFPPDLPIALVMLDDFVKTNLIELALRRYPFEVAHLLFEFFEDHILEYSEFSTFIEDCRNAERDSRCNCERTHAKK